MGCTKLKYLKIFRGLGNAGIQAEGTPGLEAYLESHPESLWAGMGMITEVGGDLDWNPERQRHLVTPRKGSAEGSKGNAGKGLSRGGALHRQDPVWNTVSAGELSREAER